MYVSTELAEEVKPGMEVQISPASTNKEDDGFIMGKVISVSQDPATKQSMTQKLGNESLVSMMTKNGTATEVTADLITDSSTASGYKWSSSGGKSITISSDTLVTGTVVIKKEKPIGRLFPLFDDSDQ